MTRHRKFLKAERAKTKLKGANLPKGLNVTKTEFKVRKIVIPELKQKELEPGARPRFTVQECLTRLNHNNSSHRLEGLSCLRKMLDTNFDEIKSQFMAKLVQVVAALSIDIERDVRREASQLLNCIFGKAGEAAMEPFFDIVCCYLRCAMTHITSNIQEDSLLLLDTLLQHLPTLVAVKKDKILENFLDMISKLKNESQPTRTLTVRMGSKLTSNKWRIRVLERLDSLFAAIVAEERKAKSGRPDRYTRAPVKEPVERVRNTQLISPDDDDGEEVFDPLDNLPDFTEIITASTENGTITIKDEGTKIKQYMESIVPLLFETWIELKTAEENTIQPKGAIISLEAAHGLKLVLKVLIHLISLIRLYESEGGNELSQWFNQKFFDEFRLHFLHGFPFRLFVRPCSTKRERNKTNATDNVFFQNLSISKIFILHGAVNQDEANTVLEYLKYCSSHIDELQDHSNLFFGLLRGIFTEKLSWESNNLKGLLKTLVSTYTNDDDLSLETKSKLTLLLCGVVEDDKLRNRYESEELSNFIRLLPRQLLQPVVSYQIVKAVSLLCRQQCQVFLSSFNTYAVDIVKNLKSVVIVHGPNTYESMIGIASLFYWIEDVTVLKNILVAVHGLGACLKESELIIEIVKQKLVLLNKV